MPQSLSYVLVHLIFSTKNREPLIHSDIQPRLYAYITGILSQLKSPVLQIGGVMDHVHILLMLSRTISQADLVEEVKKSSSKWMKADGATPEFSWQAGYGAFSVGAPQKEKVIQYIKNQEVHHQTQGFQDEFRSFLKRSHLNYDERYLWD